MIIAAPRPVIKQQIFNKKSQLQNQFSYQIKWAYGYRGYDSIWLEKLQLREKFVKTREDKQTFDLIGKIEIEGKNSPKR